MADILIRGMEMPKDDDDYVIFTVYGDGGVVYGPLNRPHVRYKHRAVPIPEGHGRLIDVDYADEYAYDELEVANNYLTGWEAARAMQKIYQNAPTIVPAEGGNADGN